MRSSSQQLALAVCGLALAASPLTAQSTAPAADGGRRLGLLAGLNSATFGGGEAGQDADRRNGVVLGGYGVFPLSPAVSFRPELLYAQKGASNSDDGISASFNLSYVEAPLLLQFSPGTRTATGIRPHFYVGPTVALRTGCKLEAGAGGASVSVDCDRIGELFEEGEDVDTDPHRFDLLGTVGGGIAFPIGGRDLTIGARYSHGFTKVFGLDDAKNRVLSLYGSIEFPLGRR